jgi:16S rRNA processing protein RimM
MTADDGSGQPLPPSLPDETEPETVGQTGPEQEWTWLARIRRPQGRKGEVFADILTDFPEKFAERRRLWLVDDVRSVAPRAIALANHWLHKSGIVLHFSGVDSIDDAEKLAGIVVAIPRAQRVPLAEDETYIGDLIGCLLVDVAGGEPAPLGLIENVDRTAGPVALLVVNGAAGEILVPFAKSYLRKIDLKAKRVEMALPEGLVDLNAPGNS